MAQLPRLKVSDNKHFLVTKEGKPFFWLADTGWELFHQPNKEQAEEYFKRRAGQRDSLLFRRWHCPNWMGYIPPIPMAVCHSGTMIHQGPTKNIFNILTR